MKKVCNRYYLSVDGETEKWYFERLQELINNKNDISYNVKFYSRINESITSTAKLIPALYKPTKVFHICDYESNEKEHLERFNKILEELNNVKKINKNLDYKLGYSNFSFDLWILLHKKQQKGSVSNRKQYIKGINKAYNENFQCIDDYKEEKNFKRILQKIELDDVIQAIKNSNEIRKMNEENSKDKCRIYGDFVYYTENPDLTINECVEQILNECGIITRVS